MCATRPRSTMGCAGSKAEPTPDSPKAAQSTTPKSPKKKSSKKIVEEVKPEPEVVEKKEDEEVINVTEVIAELPVVKEVLSTLYTGLSGLFSYFTAIDLDKSGALDATELEAALLSSEDFKAAICKAAGLAVDMEVGEMVKAVIAKADINGNGVLEANELERLLNGWGLDQHDALAGAEMRNAREKQRLAGATERAGQTKADGGGFGGLTDSAEALAIGEAAQAKPSGDGKVVDESAASPKKAVPEGLAKRLGKQISGFMGVPAAAAPAEAEPAAAEAAPAPEAEPAAEPAAAEAEPAKEEAAAPEAEAATPA